ncbi:hypothetical protein FNV43_RR10075 [Rhamnella rubrinervis]|uniref:ADP-ribosyl cyclase/cyclic ADP-ribose hydrolase n=1 Tax=Rhamnella rubrinervis TaxID=2594499 RepID=A0A8K0MKJ4_9ROSA|nr:hypothetical protein FNV43_RR10075 [Rhamnella rubrinervis]
MASFCSFVSSSHSSSTSRDKHDVFISFRGEDTRDGFTSFLYEALNNKAIQAYMDDHQLEKGDEISPTLMNAIEESKISLIIFSENYASSTWCLNELAKIIECQKRNGQIVIPVFYRIDPSIVRKQEEVYAAAFEKLEERFRDDLEKVNQWRKALKHAADLCGLDSNKFRPESKLVQEIVEDISWQLCKYQSSTDVFEKLFGIEERIRKLESSLRMCSDDVQIIGIWGMGGIGKTTLASAIFQKLRHRFEGCCSLWNVREESATHGPDQFRKKLLTELFNDRSIQSLDTPSIVPTYIRKRFRRKKVLIVLDDVDSSIDLEALINGYEDLAPGSRIIVTTKDAHVLKNVTKEIYEVLGLDPSESLDLFHLHAFRMKRPAKEYEMLSEKVANYANGNPLALKVLGSFLHSRPLDEWESALRKLEMVPNKDIQKVLRISYEGLDDMERELFLDIACFFACSSGKFTRQQVESIVDEDSTPKLGISVLNERALVTIVGCKHDNTIRMHNLVQQMGSAMVFDEHREPGKRSRLCMPKDISRVLETSSGTAAIKSISLHVCDLEKDVKMSPKAFSKMSNLQYFQIIRHEDAKFRLLLPDERHGLEFYPSNNLRYFCWDFYPYKSFPPGLIPENLVRLTLKYSQLVEFWNEDKPPPALEKLKHVDLHGSENLTKMPNLSRAINIEYICLAGCASLVQVPSYFKNLDKLRFLDLKDCSNLIIDVEGISGKNLTQLRLGGTKIEAMPSSIGCLSNLLELDLHDCERLKILPTSICKLKSLMNLDLSGCVNLEKFPEILEPMELGSINLRGTRIKELPESSIANLNSLLLLDLRCCENIEFLLNNKCFLRHFDKLVKLDLSNCENLESLRELPPFLQYLNVRFCEKLKSIQEIPPYLTILEANHCKSLETVSSWSTPLVNESDFLRGCSYRFDNCQKLDQNTRNNIIPHVGSLQILSAARSTKEDYGLSMIFCYPGDDVPKYFIGHDHADSEVNSIKIGLPPNWCDANFLGFAFCFVIDLSEVAYEKLFDHTEIECMLNFNDDGGAEYRCKVPVKWYFQCSKLNSDHVLILYDHDLSYKMLQENFSLGANWCSITKASFDFRLGMEYVEGSKYSSFRQSDVWSEHLACHGHRKIIKKCGVWLIYDQKEEEETTRFADEKVHTNTEGDESYLNIISKPTKPL